MAVPSNARILRGAPLKSGIMLGVSPSSDPTFDVEIARASSSGVYATIARLTGKGEGVAVLYTDLMPVDNASRSYKARAVKDGYLAGDYTSAVTAKPIVLPEIAPNITPLTGKALGSPLYVSTGGGGIPFGQPSTGASYTKTMRIAAADFMPTNETQKYSLNNGEMATNVLTTVTNDFTCPVTVPFDAVVTRFGFLSYRGSTAARVTISLDTHTTSGAVGGTSLTATATSYALLATTVGVPLTASSVRSVYATLTMVNGLVGANNARLVWLDITYGTPSFQASL